MPSSKAFLPPEAGRELERLATVVAERVEGAHQEVAIGDRLAHLHRAVPGGEHRDVVLVELGDRLGVVLLELLVGDLVDPGAHRLAEELAARLPPTESAIALMASAGSTKQSVIRWGLLYSSPGGVNWSQLRLAPGGKNRR